MGSGASKTQRVKEAASEKCRQVDTLLSSHSKLFRNTREIWTQKLRGLPDAREKLGEHLDSMFQSLVDPDRQAENTVLQEEYKDKDGEELVTSGSFAVLCDVIMESLQSLGDNGQKALRVLLKFCNISGKVIRAVAAHGQLLSALVVTLDQLYKPDRAALSVS